MKADSELHLVGCNEVVIPNRVFARPTPESNRIKAEPSKHYAHISLYNLNGPESIIRHIASTAKRVLEHTHQGLSNSSASYSLGLETAMSALPKTTQEQLADTSSPFYRLILRQLQAIGAAAEKEQSGLEYLLGMLPDTCVLKASHSNTGAWYVNSMHSKQMLAQGYGIQLQFWLKFEKSRLGNPKLPQIDEVMELLRKGHINSPFLTIEKLNMKPEKAMQMINLLYESLPCSSSLELLEDCCRKTETLAIWAIEPFATIHQGVQEEPKRILTIDDVGKQEFSRIISTQQNIIGK
jgi:hypothetical protein